MLPILLQKPKTTLLSFHPHSPFVSHFLTTTTTPLHHRHPGCWPPPSVTLLHHRRRRLWPSRRPPSSLSPSFGKSSSLHSIMWLSSKSAIFLLWIWNCCCLMMISDAFVPLDHALTDENPHLHCSWWISPILLYFVPFSAITEPCPKNINFLFVSWFSWLEWILWW